MNTTELTEKLKEFLMGCECTDNVITFFAPFGNKFALGDSIAHQLAKQLAPEIEKMLPRESWSKDIPNKSGDWWQWDGNDESAPILFSVLFSGTTDEYFISSGQSGLSSPIYCKEMGGWWKFCPIPTTPKIKSIQKGPMG